MNSSSCRLLSKSATVKALLSEEAREGKRKVRKIMIWSIEAGGQTERRARYASILQE